MKKLKYLLERLPSGSLTAVCLLAILWLTLASKPLGDNEIELFPNADKVAHTIMFGGFTFCILLDYLRLRDWKKPTLKIEVISIIASISLGVITEILQLSMHAGRSGDALDILADSIGAILTASAFHIYYLRHLRNQKNL